MDNMVKTPFGACLKGEITIPVVSQLTDPMGVWAREFEGNEFVLEVSEVIQVAGPFKMLVYALALILKVKHVSFIIEGASDNVKESLHQIKNWDKLFQFR